MKSFYYISVALIIGTVVGYLVPLILFDILNFPIELPICVLLGMVLSMQVLNYLKQNEIIRKDN